MNEPPAGREEPPTGRNVERVGLEMRKSDTFYNPTENATETALQVCLSSDPGAPRNDKEAGTCEERELWVEGRDKEYDNSPKDETRESIMNVPIVMGTDRCTMRRAWKKGDRVIKDG
jgi:hypothetical protein